MITWNKSRAVLEFNTGMKSEAKVLQSMELIKAAPKRAAFIAPGRDFWSAY